MKYSALGTLTALISFSLLAACGDDAVVSRIGDKTPADVDAGTKPVKTSKPAESATSATPSQSASGTTAASASATTATTSTPTDSDASVGVVTDSGVPVVPSTTPTASATVEPVTPPTECPSVDELRQDPDNIEVVTGVNEDTVWTCEKIYLLAENTPTVVTENSTLEIGPGTHVFGRAGSSLIVTAGSRLIAEGEKENPVVFTSAKQPGSRNPADWGGILLMGNAPINQAGGTAKGEGISPTLPYANYGGNDPEHDCGSLKYVRVEYGGFIWAENKELNNLGVAGCGSKTKIHYVQVHKGTDDGIEFWGGSPEVSHIVSTYNDDDGFDWTFGFSSKVQFVLIAETTDVGIEADNSETEFTAQPISNPELYNFTIFGTTKSPAMVLRAGTKGKIYNTIVQDAPKGGVDVRSKISADFARDGSLSVENSIFFNNGVGNFFDDSPTQSNAAESALFDDGLEESALFAQADKHNQIGVDPGITFNLNANSRKLVPDANSPAAQGAVKPPQGFDRGAEYIGAFEPGGEDWTEGWTTWEEN